MNILEKEIEDIVFETSNETLSSIGLDLLPNKMRQVNLGSYGISDIICWGIVWKKYPYNRDIHIQIVELKKDLVDVNTMMQSARYEKGIKLFINQFNLVDTEIHIEHILIGKKVQTNGDFMYLLDSNDKYSVFTYSIDVEKGIVFTQRNNFCIKNASLSNMTRKSILKIIKHQL